MTMHSRIRKDLLGPNVGDVHVNAPLTMYSEAYLLDGSIGLAGNIGICPVDKKTDVYWVWSRADLLRTKAAKRAVGTESQRVGFGLTTGSYTAEPYGVAHDIEDGTLANADAGLDLERSITAMLTDGMVAAEESEFCSSVLAASTWTGSTTGADITPGTLWSAGGSTPIADVAAQRNAIIKKNRRAPNVAIMGAEVWEKLTTNADILNRLGLGGNPNDARQVTKQAVAALFQVDQILVTELSENTGNAGGTDTYAFMGGKHMFLGHVPNTNAILTPSAFKRFYWRMSGSPAALGAGNSPRRVIRYRKEPRTTVIEVEGAFVTKVTAPTLGAFFYNVVA